MNMNKYLDIAPEVQQALADGRPVVALESTIISHGMPYPKNVETALLVEQTLRDNGAVPDYAECTLSYRYLDASALNRLEALLQRMQAEPFDPRTHMEIIQKSLRPAMQPHAATYALLDELERAGEAVGQKVTCLVTGGGSDGNFISHYGVATLDGCGPCGGKMHTREEYLMTKTVEQRLDLMYVLLTRLFRRCPD